MKTFSGRSIVPQNIEAEESILGGVLLDPEAIGRALREGLAVDDFYVQQHRTLYRGLLELHKAGKPTDLVTITTWLQDKKLFEKVGGTAKLASLVDRTVSAVNVDQYAKLVREKALRRKAINQANDLIDLAYDTSKPMEVVKEKSSETTSLLVKETSEVKRGFSSAAIAATAAFERIELAVANYNNPDFSLGITTGFYDLDRTIIGLDKGNLTTLLADSGVGKSALSQNLAINVALSGQGTVLYFSTGELNQELVMTRMISRFSGVEINNLRRGRLRNDSERNDYEKLISALETIGEMDLHINDEPLTATQIHEEVKNFKSLNPEKEVALVIVDYIQNVDTSDYKGIGHENVVHVVKTLKTIAADCETHVFAPSQVKQSAAGVRPQVSDADGSKTIRDKSQLVLGAFREEPGHPDSDLLQIAVLKNTSGEEPGWRSPIKLQLNLAVGQVLNSTVSASRHLEVVR